MALNDIVQSIKEFFSRLTKRQKALPEPKTKAEPHLRTVYATNNPSDWRRSLSVDIQPQRHTVKTKVSEKYMLSGSRHQHEEAQLSSQRLEFRRKVAAIALSATLALSPAIAIYKHFNPNYHKMETEKLIQCLSNEDLSDSDLDTIRTELGDRGLDLIKEKVAESLEIDYSNDPQLLDSLITVTASEGNIPAKVNTPKGIYWGTQGDGVVDQDRANIVSDGISDYIDSTAIVRNEDIVLSSDQLANYAKQSQILIDNSLHATPNNVSGKQISADANIDDLLQHYSIADPEIQESNHNLDDEGR